MPPDVVARLERSPGRGGREPGRLPLRHTLRRARATSATFTGDTVVPLASRRRRMDIRYVSVAAAAVLVLGGGWAVLHKRTHNDDVASTASGAVSPAAAVVVEQRGTAYHASSLPDQVRSLVFGQPTLGGSASSLPATTSSATLASPNATEPAGATPTASAAVDAALTSLPATRTP